MGKKVKGSNMGKENMSKGKYEIHVVQQIYGEQAQILVQVDALEILCNTL